MCRVRIKNEAVLGMRVSHVRVGAKHGTQVPITASFKVLTKHKKTPLNFACSSSLPNHHMKASQKFIRQQPVENF